MMFQKEIQKYLTDHGFGSFVPKVVLFDMDGVLYDSMPNHAKAWQEAMAEFGIHFTAEDSYATEGMRGVDTIRIYARKQLGKELSEAEAQQMYDEKARLFHLMPTAQIFDGVIDLMQRIKADGLKIGIVTGSGQRPLIERLSRDFQDFVEPEHIVTAYDIEHGKPAPDSYLKGLKLAGDLKPWEGIVVENAPMGVRAGVAANIFTIGINSGILPDTALTREGANAVFPSIREFSNHWDALLK